MLLKQTINPRRAINVNINASLEFLAQVMPRPLAPFHRCLEGEKLLEQPCINDLPTEHKPDEKWMAVRLKVPHEARSRMLPKVRRQLKQYGGIAGDKEVWMHMAPSTDEIKSRSGRGCPDEQRENVQGIEKSDETPSQDRQPAKGFIVPTTPV